ncbi:hypothetical protein BsWGS_15800 [Bradybaena similaris]
MSSVSCVHPFVGHLMPQKSSVSCLHLCVGHFMPQISSVSCLHVCVGTSCLKCPQCTVFTPVLAPHASNVLNVLCSNHASNVLCSPLLVTSCLKCPQCPVFTCVGHPCLFFREPCPLSLPLPRHCATEHGQSTSVSSL